MTYLSFLLCQTLLCFHSSLFISGFSVSACIFFISLLCFGCDSLISSVSLNLLLFSTTCITASSSAETSKTLSDSGSSTSSALPSSSAASSSSSNSHTEEGREAEVRLLPPLLKDQAWGVHAQEAFLLFCLALGEWFLNPASLLAWLGSPSD